MIRWNCISCHELLEAPESLGGGSLACPRCGTGNAIPSRFWAIASSRWFLVAFAGGMLLAGVWLGTRMGRTTIVVNGTAQAPAGFMPDSAKSEAAIVQDLLLRANPDDWRPWQDDMGGFRTSCTKHREITMRVAALENGSGVCGAHVILDASYAGLPSEERMAIIAFLLHFVAQTSGVKDQDALFNWFGDTSEDISQVTINGIEFQKFVYSNALEIWVEYKLK